MEKSPLAIRLELLRSSVIKLTRERERLPKELFWSLLSSEINIIREQKDKQRLKRKIWLSGGEET